MSWDDRIRWDERYTSRGAPSDEEPCLATPFLPHQELFPVSGLALDVACGQGLGAIWLARRGLRVWGLDVSEVAIAQARELAQRNGVSDRCRFDVADLDNGIPAGPPVDIIYCNRFRESQLDHPMMQRLAPGGLLAITALSEVGGSPGPFRVGPGELTAAFAALDPIAAGEGDGQAWLLARRGAVEEVS